RSLPPFPTRRSSDLDITAAGGTPGDAISVLSMYSVTFPADEDAADASTLAANADVAAVEQDQARDTAGTPDDTRYSEQWSLPQRSEEHTSELQSLAY